MPHPSKTSREAIVAAAVEIVDRGGAEGLSMRAVARKLGLAPNALYYYFPNRPMLEAAVAAEGVRRIHAVLKKSAAGQEGADGVRRACRSYLRFARAHPALYAMTMKKHPDCPELLAARAGFSALLAAVFAGIGSPQAAAKANFASWALLHGLAVLERDALLESAELSAEASVAVSALLAGLSKA
jgi:AcrR family transcriptional regulator